MGLPLSIEFAGADGDDFAAGRLFLGGFGEEDAAGGLVSASACLTIDTIIEGSSFMLVVPLLCLTLY